MNPLKYISTKAGELVHEVSEAIGNWTAKDETKEALPMAMPAPVATKRKLESGKTAWEQLIADNIAKREAYQQQKAVARLVSCPANSFT